MNETIITDNDIRLLCQPCLRGAITTYLDLWLGAKTEEYNSFDILDCAQLYAVLMYLNKKWHAFFVDMLSGDHYYDGISILVSEDLHSRGYI